MEMLVLLAPPSQPPKFTADLADTASQQIGLEWKNERKDHPCNERSMWLNATDRSQCASSSCLGCAHISRASTTKLLIGSH